MGKRTGPTNVYLRQLIDELKKNYYANKSKIWLDVAEKLEKARRKKVEVNLKKIEKFTQKNDTVVVPGIVLASGELTKPVTIAAWKFTAAAKEKIKKSKCKMLGIDELMKENPKGARVKILV